MDIIFISLFESAYKLISICYKTDSCYQFLLIFLQFFHPFFILNFVFLYTMHNRLLKMFLLSKKMRNTVKYCKTKPGISEINRVYKMFVYHQLHKMFRVGVKPRLGWVTRTTYMIFWGLMSVE